MMSRNFLSFTSNVEPQPVIKHALAHIVRLTWGLLNTIGGLASPPFILPTIGFVWGGLRMWALLWGFEGNKQNNKKKEQTILNSNFLQCPNEKCGLNNEYVILEHRMDTKILVIELPEN